jgi:hypothetical protein
MANPFVVGTPIWSTRVPREPEAPSRWVAANRARWDSTPAVERRALLSWVRRVGWAQVPAEKRSAIARRLNMIRWSVVERLPCVGEPLVIVLRDGREVSAASAPLKARRCWRCGSANTQAYREHPYRLRVGRFCCDHHRFVKRSQYGTGAA